MKWKRFTKSFVGAFIGTSIYKLFFNISDPFKNAWANFLLETLLMAVFVFIGLLLVSLITGGIWPSNSGKMPNNLFKLNSNNQKYL